jgi:hypothetical protein
VMQGGESEVQQSVRKLLVLFGQVLVEVGNLMGAHAQAALPAGEPAAGSAAEAGPWESAPAVGPAVRSAQGPASEANAEEAPRAADSGALPEDVHERIERAVDTGLSILVREENAAVSAAQGEGPEYREDGPEADEPAARGNPPIPALPEARILRPAWMRADAPAFPGEDSGRSAVPAPSGEDSGTAAAPEPDAAEQPPEAFKAGDLFLVCLGQQGRNLAIPWNWVVDTHLSPRGTPEAFTLAVGGDERQVIVSSVVGIWTKAELEQWQEEVRWLSSLETLRPAPPASPEPLPTPSSAAGAPAAGAAGPAPSPVSTPSPTIWVVSPSALARRFLLRHLEHSGLEIHEARDLDDPLLPADLQSMGALFLDECLQEQWRDHPSGRSGGPPLVLLTVDGVLHVPPAGERPAAGAVLPRPFERSEVESVIGWLRSLWHPDRAGGGEDHGDEEDDTWLFADPFGSSGP